jgi:PD-(D/E)XK nuclease superfamily protein
MSFRGCRRRWNWVFGDRYYPVTTPKPLEFGSAFHKAMETWYEPTMWNKDPETRLTLTLLAFRKMCLDQKSKYLTINEVGDLDPDVEQDFKERIELGEGMIRYHCMKVSPKLDVNLIPKHVEVSFEVPITNPDTGEQLWCKCDNCWKLWQQSPHYHEDFHRWANIFPNPPMPTESYVRHYQKHVWMGLPVTYGGRIDCLMEDDLGRLWIVDWKTAARLSGQEDGDTPDDFLQLEDQITSYVWALRVLGIQVAGFIHHEMKKAFPEAPEPNKVQRKGCWYSVNKTQNTSYDLYYETISEGDPGGLASGAYDEFLDYLKAEGIRFHSRKQVHRNETELKNAGKNIYLEAVEMTRRDLPIYPSPGRFGCNFCAYRQPCLATNQGEDVEYLFLSNFEHRPHRYWEEVVPSTESKGGA